MYSPAQTVSRFYLPKDLQDYAYTLWTDPRFVLPQRAPFVWSVRGLNLEAMDRAAALLAGTHDFASFQNAGTELKTTIRTLEPIIRVPGLCSGEWILHFQADGFLKQMVRNIEDRKSVV